MTQILRQNVTGRHVVPPLNIPDRRRRRLSTLVARHADRSRPFIVSLHRPLEPAHPTDDTIRLREAWKSTLVGPNDVVAITYLPLGGGGGGGMSGKQIGGAIAMIALAVAAPWAVAAAFPALAGTFAGSLLAAGIVAGGGYLISRATQPKANKQKEDEDHPIYGVSGGGNKPRKGDRIPRGYGHFWHPPDLTQPDYILNDGDEQILYKRMTLGLGYYHVHAIQVGKVTAWTEAGGVVEPFIGTQVEIIQPGAISNLVPGTVLSSDDVQGVQLPHSVENPAYAGPFLIEIPDDAVDAQWQFDFTIPQLYGTTTNSKTGASNQVAAGWWASFEAAPADEDGLPAGPYTVIFDRGGGGISTRPQRFTSFATARPGRWLVRAQNKEAFGPTIQNDILWDGLRVHLRDTIIRPHVTEIAMKIRSGKQLGVTQFADVYVEATARIPVWNGLSWQLLETRKAVWASADVLRGECNGIVYGGGLDNDQIDLGRHNFYADTINENDTFDGVIRGPVSVFEACCTILGVIRAEPTRLGNSWSITRDEPRNARKHIFTRREIVKGSTGTSFQISKGDGSADVIVEYSPDGDPRRRREVRKTFGSASLTPQRLNAAGITTHEHAEAHATWIAASNYYRRQRHTLTSELAGRLVARNDPVLIDAWFLTDGRAAGVVDRPDTYTLQLDASIEFGPDLYAVFRDLGNREWGPVRVDSAPASDQIVINAEDVQNVAAFYGYSFETIFADAEVMPSVVIGKLTEIREPYIIQSAEPQGRDRINIEALHDHPSVWIALGEAPSPEPPIGGRGDATLPAIPRVAWIRGIAIQKTTGLFMEWAVGPARGAAQIIVDLTYDDWATFERVSESLETSGTYPLRHVENTDVELRAFAVSPEGIVGPEVLTSFRTFKPVISADNARLAIDFTDMVLQLQRDIRSINDLGPGTLRDALKTMNEKVEQLAAAAVTHATTAYESRELIKLAADGAMAAVEEEKVLRVSEDEALAATLDTHTARLDGEDGFGSSTAIEGVRTRVTAAEDGIEAQGQLIEALTATVNDPETGLVGTATAVNQLKTAVGWDGTEATAITALSTEVDGHSATLTVLAQSVDAQSVQFGIVGYIDNVAGGLVITGARRLDGQVEFAARFHGDFFVSGTISGTALKVGTGQANFFDINTLVVRGTAQIENLVVGTPKITNFAVNQPYQAVAGLTGIAPDPNPDAWPTVLALGFAGSPSAYNFLSWRINASRTGTGQTIPRYRIVREDNGAVVFPSRQLEAPVGGVAANEWFAYDLNGENSTNYLLQVQNFLQGSPGPVLNVHDSLLFVEQRKK